MCRLLLIIMLAATLFVGLSSRAVAQEKGGQPLQEAFQTELVYPQEEGEFQLTWTSSFSKSSRNINAIFGLEYGLTDSWQVDLEMESFARKKTEEGSISRGLGDVQIGTKYSFMNMGGSRFHSAIGFELGLPPGSANKGLTEGKIEYQPYVLVARDFPKLSGLQLFSQLGFAFSHNVTDSPASEDEPSGKTIEWNSGLFVPYRRACFTTEISWSKGAGENELYLIPGLVWKLPRNLEFGVAMPIGLSRDADRARAMVKLVYEFGGQRDELKSSQAR